MTKSSTEPALPGAWSFAELSPAELTRTWHVPAARAKAVHAELRAHHADPAWIAAALARLPAPALVVIALLAENGGMLPEHALLARAEHQHQIARDHALAGIHALLVEVLLVPLTGRWGETAFALIQPSAAALAARVIDVGLPIVPDGELARGVADDGRVLLAACTALAHVDVKLTADSRPHRGPLKRLAKTWGIAEADLERALLAGWAARLLVLDEDEILRPDLPRLRIAAAQAYAPESGDAALGALLAQLARAGRPVSQHAVARWAGSHEALGALEVLLPELVGWLPGLRAGELGGIAVLARGPAAAGEAAASVTPSFEVFLPPESRAERVVDVLACSELGRIDRAIVARITKASVARAVAAGGSRESILAALAQASRTPVPQNVEAAIRDWAAGSSAIVATGRVVVVPAADGERARAALAALVTHVLAPGVFLVDPDAPSRALTAALAKIGVVVVGATAAAMPPPTAAPRGAPRDAGPIPELPATPRSIAARARLDAWRRGDPAERVPAPPGAPPPSGDPIADVLEDWEHRAGVELDDLQLQIFSTALDVLPPALGSKLLATRSVAELERELLALAKSGMLRESLEAGKAAADAGDAPRDPLDDPSLVWHDGDPRARLERAAAQGRKVAIETPKHVHVIVPSRVIKRGAAWLVLGVDEHDNDLAIQLKVIVAVAELGPPPASA